MGKGGAVVILGRILVAISVFTPLPVTEATFSSPIWVPPPISAVPAVPTVDEYDFEGTGDICLVLGPLNGASIRACSFVYLYSTNLSPSVPINLVQTTDPTTMCQLLFITTTSSDLTEGEFEVFFGGSSVRISHGPPGLSQLNSTQLLDSTNSPDTVWLLYRIAYYTRPSFEVCMSGRVAVDFVVSAPLPMGYISLAGQDLIVTSGSCNRPDDGTSITVHMPKIYIPPTIIATAHSTSSNSVAVTTKSVSPMSGRTTMMATMMTIVFIPIGLPILLIVVIAFIIYFIRKRRKKRRRRRKTALFQNQLKRIELELESVSSNFGNNVDPIIRRLVAKVEENRQTQNETREFILDKLQNAHQQTREFQDETRRAQEETRVAQEETRLAMEETRAAQEALKKAQDETRQKHDERHQALLNGIQRGQAERRHLSDETRQIRDEALLNQEEARKMIVDELQKAHHETSQAQDEILQMIYELQSVREESTQLQDELLQRTVDKLQISLVERRQAQDEILQMIHWLQRAHEEANQAQEETKLAWEEASLAQHETRQIVDGLMKSRKESKRAVVEARQIMGDLKHEHRNVQREVTDINQKVSDLQHNLSSTDQKLGDTWQKVDELENTVFEDKLLEQQQETEAEDHEDSDHTQ